MSSNTDTRYAIGIMSGTSVDGIDAVLAAFSDDGPPRIIDSASADLESSIKDAIIALTQPGDNEIDRAGELDILLGERYAAVANLLIARNSDVSVSVIGSHGQTVRHRPNNPYPFTVQLGSGAVIATRTGVNTVTNFRASDMAAGGQGAPFAPVFHNAVFRDRESARAIVNLGGIANITLLPRGEDQPVTGFDSGPANGLMDAWIQRRLDKPFDEDGRWAASGSIHDALLSELLSHPYLKRKTPKSTGREEFHIGWVDQKLHGLSARVAPQDVQRTLLEFTAKTIADGLGDSQEIYVCGGGAANSVLTDRLSALSRLPVETTATLGIPPVLVESAAFAWLADQSLRGLPSTLPSVTGARRATIAGNIHYY